MLTLITPYQTNPSRQRLQVYLWSAVILVMFSVLVSLFRVKNRGTPICHTPYVQGWEIDGF